VGNGPPWEPLIFRPDSFAALPDFTVGISPSFGGRLSRGLSLRAWFAAGLRLGRSDWGLEAAYLGDGARGRTGGHGPRTKPPAEKLPWPSGGRLRRLQKDSPRAQLWNSRLTLPGVGKLGVRRRTKGSALSQSINPISVAEAIPGGTGKSVARRGPGGTR